ncbi:TetR/AcrR family transcriptional regulator [Salinibacterium sp.]|uniref:TetR/AcrR family transcriptional regulator n=1 Tax=Salinibacterium sp. TaxID=1915057 RepID=UPI00286A73FC|nr:TetR/AcrR family transcriptional regulator [Salinibacterium sp.]
MSRPPHTSRRDDILVAALALFNIHGTASVSTNHIAQAAGVSPGNLYYWFDNKQQILRALFEKWRDESSFTLPSNAAADSMVNALFDSVPEQVDRTRRFAVFARELVPLLHTDATLAQIYRDNYDARVTMFSEVVAQLIRAGLFLQIDDKQVRSLVQLTWIAMEFTPSFLAAIVGESPLTGMPLDGRSIESSESEKNTGVTEDHVHFEAARIISAPLIALLTPAGHLALHNVYVKETL